MQYSLVLNQDALNRRTSYAYDAVGNAVRQVDGRGLVLTMSYDALDRLVTQLYASGRRTTFVFDAAGQQTVMADESGVTSYAYDGAGRLSSVAYPQVGGLSYSYDGVGNRVQMAQSNGGLTSYVYDALDRLSVLQNPTGEVTSYVYDALDRETGRVMANGVAMNRGFDADGRTVSLSYATSAGVMRLRHTLTFDKVGNVLSQRELDGALTSFTYDVLDQLTKEERSSSHAYKRIYSYDKAGNRLTLNADGVVTTSTYDAANQIKTAKTGTPVTTFGYDGAGNRILENAASALTTFLFNQDNKMVEAALPDGTRTTQLYSADGDLRNQTTGTASTLFVRDGQVLLEEWDAVLGTVLRHYTGAPGEWSGLVSLAGTGGANSRFFLFDQLGSTRGLLDELAVLSDEFGYSAYGAELWATGGSSEPLRYAGDWQYQRLFANKMNVGARIYDATTGVWLSIDPLGFDARDFNLFRYVGDNPINFIDPDGMNPSGPYYVVPMPNGGTKMIWPESGKSVVAPPGKGLPNPSSRAPSKLQLGFQLSYGNYCGGGRSPEKAALKKGLRPPTPIDGLDACCQGHDRCWATYGCGGVSGVQGTDGSCAYCNQTLARCALQADCSKQGPKFRKTVKDIQACKALKAGVLRLWLTDGKGLTTTNVIPGVFDWWCKAEDEIKSTYGFKLSQ